MSSKKQSIISIGVGLILIGAILLVFAFSEPKEPVADLTASSSVSDVDESKNQTNSTKASTTLSGSQSNAELSQNDYTKQPSVVSVTYPLNLNTCTQLELMSINGIGESRASAIIQYREYLGGYTSTEQIKEIKGFGDSLYQKIAPYVTV